jgi:hypothetical protein
MLENRLSLAALSIIKILLILVVVVVAVVIVVAFLSSFIAAAAPLRAGPSAASGSVLSVFTAPFPKKSAELVSTASALASVPPGHSSSSILSRVRGVFDPSFAALPTPVFTFSMVAAQDCPSWSC